MSYFNFIKKPKDDTLFNLDVEYKSESKKKKISPFDLVFSIFNIIQTKKDYKVKMDELLKEVEDSELTFVVWILNHYLVYNSFTASSVELFYQVSLIMKGRDYINYYVSYMIENNLKFPKFMSYYKLGLDNDNKKYLDIISDYFKIKDDDLQEFINYISEKGISPREMCINLEYI